MSKVYLAGPIGNCTYGEATDWRIEAQSFLEDLGLQGMSPMRGKKYLDNGNRIAGGSYPYPLSTSKGIMSRDFNDARTSSVILANLSIPHEKPSFGTIMEIAWAHALQIPLILIDSPQHQYYNHPMIKEAVSFLAKDLDEALSLAAHILLPLP